MTGTGDHAEVGELRAALALEESRRHLSDCTISELQARVKDLESLNAGLAAGLTPLVDASAFDNSPNERTDRADCPQHRDGATVMAPPPPESPAETRCKHCGNERAKHLSAWWCNPQRITYFETEPRLRPCDSPGCGLVAALTIEQDKRREAEGERDSLRRAADLRSAQLLMLTSEIEGNPQLHWLHDRDDPRWTPALHEAWALRQKVKENAKQIIDLMRENERTNDLTGYVRRLREQLTSGDDYVRSLLLFAHEIEGDREEAENWRKETAALLKETRCLTC